MFGDADRAARMADLLLQRGVYVIGFSYPVVPIGKARIRTQVSAAHTRNDLEAARRSTTPLTPPGLQSSAEAAA